MKKILTIALLFAGLTAAAQTPQVKVTKVTRLFNVYERFATPQQIKTADSLRRLGFKPVDGYRIDGTRLIKVTFVKIG